MATRREPTVREVMAMAADQDRRRRLQVDNQKAVINRLLAHQGQGWTWAQEQEVLLAGLTEAHARLEKVADLVVGLKHSPLARQVLKALGPDA